MIQTEKTIIILTPGFPENETDTTCLPLHQAFIEGIIDKYPEIKVIIISFQYPYTSIQYSWKGVPVYCFNGRNKGGISKYFLRKKVFRKLSNMYQQTGHMVLLSFWYGECARVGKKFADKYRLKHFCWLQGQDAGSSNPYPRKINMAPDKIIAISELLQHEFEKNHRTKPQHVIPPGIDIRKFSREKKEKYIDLLGVGSLISLKQYVLFLKIVAAIKKTFPEILATLIGSGPEKEKLEKMSVELGIEKNINFSGVLSYEEVLKKMQVAKILLHPSAYEGFSMVCLEALYAGARIISFHKPMKENIQNWDNVSSNKEMLDRALQLLTNYQEPSQKILPYPIETTITRMMNLLFE